MCTSWTVTKGVSSTMNNRDRGVDRFTVVRTWLTWRTWREYARLARKAWRCRFCTEGKRVLEGTGPGSGGQPWRCEVKLLLLDHFERLSGQRHKSRLWRAMIMLVAATCVSCTSSSVLNVRNARAEATGTEAIHTLPEMNGSCVNCAGLLKRDDMTN